MLISVQRHLHRSGRYLLVLVMGVVILSLLYFGPGKPSKQGQMSDYRIYGQTVSPKDFENAQDEYAFALTLQIGRPIHRNDVNSLEDHQRILMQLALMEKARRLGLRVTDLEIGERIRALPVFQVNGLFNEDQLNKILSSELPQRHLTEESFRRIIADQIMMMRLNELIAATALIPPDEIDDFLRIVNEKVEMAVARFDRKSFKAPADPGDAELRAYYQENAEAFRVPARVKVAYVEFPIKTTPEDSGITEEELRAMYDRHVARVTAGQGAPPPPFKEMKPIIQKALLQQKAVDHTDRLATDFSLKFATDAADRPDFGAAAVKAGLKVRETGYVGSPSEVEGIKSPDQFFREVIKLSKENPVSLPIVGDDVMIVAYWQDARESHVPPFEENRSTVLEAWRADQTLKQAREAGRAGRAKFEELLAEGKTFAQATKTVKASWESLPAFTFREIKPTDANRFYQQASLGLPAGVAGDFQPDPTGGFFVFVKKREPADPAVLGEQRLEATMRLNEQTRSLVLYEFREKVLEESGLLPLFIQIDEANSASGS